MEDPDQAMLSQKCCKKSHAHKKAKKSSGSCGKSCPMAKKAKMLPKLGNCTCNNKKMQDCLSNKIQKAEGRDIGCGCTKCRLDAAKKDMSSGSSCEKTKPAGGSSCPKCQAAAEAAKKITGETPKSCNCSKKDGGSSSSSGDSGKNIADLIAKIDEA